VSRDFRHGLKQTAKTGLKKAKREDVSPRPDRMPTKQHCENVLRHAVRNQDLDALEDYDEHDI
jgi:hypothetical protein